MSRNYFYLGLHQQDIDDEAYREDVREERRELMKTLVRMPCNWCATRGCIACAGYGYTVEERK